MIVAFFYNVPGGGAPPAVVLKMQDTDDAAKYAKDHSFKHWDWRPVHPKEERGEPYDQA